MIQMQTNLDVADNSGARRVMVRATFDALKHQDSPRSVAARRNIKVSTLQSRRVGGDAEVVAE